MSDASIANLSDLVKKLREQTGAKIMDCRSALVETGGDMGASKDWLRAKGMASATEKMGRAAGQGGIVVGYQDGYGVIFEMNCETDFVARGTDFIALAKEILDCSVMRHPPTLDDMRAMSVGEASISDRILEVAGKVSENIVLRRMRAIYGSHLCSYVHAALDTHIGRIGVILALECTGEAPTQALEDLGHKICMHIASASPRYLKLSDVPQEVIAHERDILYRQVHELSPEKPLAVQEKMVEGRLAKFFEECVLEEQKFVFDPTLRVTDVLRNAQNSLNITQISITDFQLYVLGQA